MKFAFVRAEIMTKNYLLKKIKHCDTQMIKHKNGTCYYQRAYNTKRRYQKMLIALETEGHILNWPNYTLPDKRS